MFLQGNELFNGKIQIPKSEKLAILNLGIIHVL